MGSISDNEYNYFDKAVNRFGKTNGNFLMEVSKGNAIGHEEVTIFGYNPDVDTGGSVEDITPQGGTYTFLSDSGEGIQIQSDNASDTGVVMGVLGLDENFLEVQVPIVLNGTTPVVIPGLWSRINRVFNIGSTEHLGTVDITDTGTGLINPARILAGDQSTKSAVFTVPVGKRGYLLLIGSSFNRNNNSGSNAIIKLKNRPKGGVFLTAARYGMQRDGNSFVSVTPPTIGSIHGGTDVKMSAEASHNNTDISSFFQLLIVDDKFSK